MAIPRITLGSRVGHPKHWGPVDNCSLLVFMTWAYCCRYVQPPSKWLPFVGVKPQGFLDIWMVVTEMWYWILLEKSIYSLLMMVNNASEWKRLGQIDFFLWSGKHPMVGIFQRQERKWWRRLHPMLSTRSRHCHFNGLKIPNCWWSKLCSRANWFTTSWEIMITWAPWPSPEQAVNQPDVATSWRKMPGTRWLTYQLQC